VDSLITKKSREDRLPFNMPIFIIIRQKRQKIKLHFGYKCSFSFTAPAFRFQKLHFAYKYLVMGYKYCISFYKVAFRLTIKHLFIVELILTHILLINNILLLIFIIFLLLTYHQLRAGSFQPYQY